MGFFSRLLERFPLECTQVLSYSNGMKAYSQDLRDRIIEAMQAHTDTREGIARTFRVSRSFVQKLWRRWQETRSNAALPHGVDTPVSSTQSRSANPYEKRRHRMVYSLRLLCTRMRKPL